MASIPLAIFCVNFIFMFPNMLLSQYMISIGSQKAVLVFMSIVALLNIIVNIFAIPAYGVVGAALATMASEITFCALSFIFLHVRNQFRMDCMPAIKMFAVAIVLVVIGFHMAVPVVFHSAIIALLFISSTYYLRAYDYSCVYKLLLKSQYQDKGYIFR
jgi:O-antigen/teichoic acid export membrane protein